MSRLLRVRPLVFLIVAGALIVTLASTLQAGRARLRTRLQAMLPAEEIRDVLADHGDAFVAPVVVALVLAVAAALIVGALVRRPLLRLQRELLVRGHAVDVALSRPAIEELRDVVTAIERQQRELHGLALRAAQERDELAELVASVSEGILQLSSDGRIIHANPAAHALLGLPEQSGGQPLTALVRHAELRSLLEQAAAGVTIGSCEVSLDERRVFVAARPVHRPSGNGPGGAVVALADLTEVRRLEEVRRDFVANVSHELKTPLTAIGGYVETVLSDEHLSPEMQRQFLEVVQRNADRLHHIVDDLLDLSRLESGGWRPELQPVDAAALAAEVWEEFEERARRKRIEHRITGDDALVNADPVGLQQVLSNLLDNAMRHTPDGGRITIRITLTPDKRVALEVSDSGTGIPSDALPRVFERFYRVDPARSRAEGGTGLGLSIVKHLVERMAGSVTARSQLGKGTTIRILLPAA